MRQDGAGADTRREALLRLMAANQLIAILWRSHRECVVDCLDMPRSSALPNGC